MTLKDSNGLVMQYSMVNVKNYNTVAVGDTLQSTLNRYLEALTNTNISLEGSNSEESLVGEVERIGLVVKEGSRAIIMEVESLVSKTFTPYPTRIAETLVKDKVNTLISILEIRGGINLYDKNVIIKTT